MQDHCHVDPFFTCFIEPSIRPFMTCFIATREKTTYCPLPPSWVSLAICQTPDPRGTPRSWRLVGGPPFHEFGRGFLYLDRPKGERCGKKVGAAMLKTSAHERPIQPQMIHG